MRGQKEVGKVLILYSILAVALTSPLIFHMTDHLPSDLGDPLYNIWIMDWDKIGKLIWSPEFELAGWHLGERPPELDLELDSIYLKEREGAA